jgi:hypothetical protein
MKLFLGCAVILGLSMVSAMAGDGGLSHQSLAKVGLGGMAMLSDSQGLEIRGLGVSEEMNGDQWNYGDNDHHQKKDHHQKGDQHHEQKHHEKNHEECHEHEKCGHSTCHVSSLCHVQCASHTR